MGKPQQQFQRLDKMKMKRAEQRNRENAEIENETNFVGCPVPHPVICSSPKIEADAETGIKMACTNENCNYQMVLLHPNCFREFEKSLVRRLESIGSARGWTNSQRLNNLWEKKGQALIGKHCRCRCGAGLIVLDKQAAYEREKAEIKKRKERKNKKDLPKLQFVTNITKTLSKSIDNDLELADESSKLISENDEYLKNRVSTLTDILALQVIKEMGKNEQTSYHFPKTLSYVSAAELSTEKDVQSLEEADRKDSGVETRSSSINSMTCEKETTKVAMFESDDEASENGRSFYSRRRSFDSSSTARKIEVSPIRKEKEFELSFDQWPPITQEASPRESKSSSAILYPLTSTPKAVRQKSDKSNSSARCLQMRQGKTMLMKSGVAIVQENATQIVKTKSIGVQTIDPDQKKSKESKLDEEGWTPFFGRGFNLGEQLRYIP